MNASTRSKRQRRPRGVRGPEAGRPVAGLRLWWDRATLDDLTAWKQERQNQGAKASDWFVCSQSTGTAGLQLDRRNARNRFLVGCRVLGADRQHELTIHHGRHSFVSHALAGGRSLAEVRDAAGHASIATTSVYTHVATDDDGAVGDLFEFESVAATPA